MWPLVTSTADNCLGQECPAWSKCHLVEARRQAQEADVVVINHHLLCADFAIKDDGFGELLPAADAFIIDEAHQLPDIANQFFGVNLSARQLQELAAGTDDLPTILSAWAGSMALQVGADRLTLSVICDVSCDPSSDFNPLPIYRECSDFKNPCLRIIDGSRPLDLIAIDHLPSLLPAESSDDFSSQLLPSLLDIGDDTTGVWRRARELFLEKSSLLQ